MFLLVSYLVLTSKCVILKNVYLKNNSITALHPNALPAPMRDRAFGDCSCHVNQRHGLCLLNQKWGRREKQLKHLFTLLAPYRVDDAYYFFNTASVQSCASYVIRVVRDLACHGGMYWV